MTFFHWRFDHGDQAGYHSPPALLFNIFSIAASLQNMSYWLQEDIHNYLQASQLPALEEFTMCFFFEPNPQNLLSIVSPEAQIEALISIASEGSISYLIVRTMQSAGCQLSSPFLRGDNKQGFFLHDDSSHLNA